MRRGTLANPSTRWHSVPLSSDLICDFVPSEHTAHITERILSSFTITVCVSFPQGHGQSAGVLRSLGKGRGHGVYLNDCVGV